MRSGAIALFVLSLAARIAAYPAMTTDYTYFAKPWLATLAAHPWLSAFATPFSDYAPLYLYLLKLASLVPLPALALVKLLSFGFDIAIAAAGYAIVRRFLPSSRDTALLAAATLFALPTVVANSALWGQSDALYGSLVLFSSLALLAALPLAAAILYGLALSAKVQAIFFLPVFAGWLYRRGALLRYGWIPPAVFALSVVPAWVSGGNLWYWLFIYAHEAGEYPYLSVSAQSVFAFVQPLGISLALADALFWAGIAAAAAAAAALAWYVACVPRLSARATLLAAFAAGLILPYLLPRMHERYFYLADLFAVLYAFFAPPRWWVAALVVFSSLLSYAPFLSGQLAFLSGVHVDLRIPATLLLLPIGAVVYDLAALSRAPLSPLALSRPEAGHATVNA
ncbi:MAG: hypothetical protein KGH97_03330 [Patescibacteria group bacterium]|nr:hypothetical protein [Patescibacteria group bacterium]